jgi:hypothetical protein
VRRIEGGVILKSSKTPGHKHSAFVSLRFPASKHVTQAMMREYLRCLEVYREARREVRIMQSIFRVATSFEAGELTCSRQLRDETVEIVVEACRSDDAE